MIAATWVATRQLRYLRSGPIARHTRLLTDQRKVSAGDVMALCVGSHVEVAGVSARCVAFSDGVVLDDWLYSGFGL